MAKHGAKFKQAQVQTLGQRFLYAGMVETSCENCGAKQSRGMMSAYKDMRFCSERCVVDYDKNDWTLT